MYRPIACSVVLLLPLFAGGCQIPLLLIGNAGHMTVERATTPREAKTFRVLDGETGRPVCGARLVLHYDFEWMDPWNDCGGTDADGVKTFGVATRFLHLMSGKVSADGYRPRDFEFGLGRNTPASPGVSAWDGEVVEIAIWPLSASPPVIPAAGAPP